MTDATTAAKAIWERPISGSDSLKNHQDAGVVLARLNEAIAELETIRALAPDLTPTVYFHATRALACLRSEDS